MRPDFQICDDHVRTHAGKFAQKASPCPACGKINRIFLSVGTPLVNGGLGHG